MSLKPQTPKPSEVSPSEQSEGAGALGVVVTEEMVGRAMAQLGRYDLASEYVDRDMMREILRAALECHGASPLI
jgi:hypothetical protein